jgi:nucleoside-diphosphate-sugar epimerase
MRKVFITGGTGFIGRAIVGKLIAAGHRVTVFDNFSRNASNFEIESKALRLIKGDVQDFKTLNLEMAGSDSVLHLAYINGTSNFYTRPKEILDVALYGALNVMKAIEKNNVIDYLFMSSSEVYQNPNIFPTPENIPLIVPDLTNPRYSYGLGKIVGEFLAFHGFNEDVRTLIVRPHNVYGPQMGHEHIVPMAIGKILDYKFHRNDSVDILGNGNQTRSFIHIEDFADAVLHCFFLKNMSGVVHIGTETEITIQKVFEIISEFAEIEPNFSYLEAPLGETQRRLPSVKRLQNSGFSPRQSLESGLLQTFEWYKRDYLNRI